MYSLKNKIAVVTGGGSGIGKAICLVFAAAGARIYILDIDEKGSAETVSQIQQAGGQAEFLACGVDQEISVQMKTTLKLATVRQGTSLEEITFIFAKGEGL